MTSCFEFRELGSGAFSIVKYARLINKDKPRSLWPEYAVKVRPQLILSISSSQSFTLYSSRDNCLHYTDDRSRLSHHCKNIVIMLR